jgi:hypothetical protein
MALEENQGNKYTRIALDPTVSIWFSQFIEGCKRRMGKDYHPNRDIVTDLIKALLDMWLTLSEKATVPAQNIMWVKTGFYLAASYVTSLRGPEGRLLDLEGMWSQRNLSPGSTVIALQGKVKGETAVRAQLLPCVHVTSSRADLRMWMDLCLLENQEEGRTGGPAISNKEGFVMSAADIDE